MRADNTHAIGRSQLKDSFQLVFPRQTICVKKRHDRASSFPRSQVAQAGNADTGLLQNSEVKPVLK